MYFSVDHATPRQAPPLCTVPRVLCACSLEKSFMGLSDVQEQPGNMNGQYLSEKLRLSWRQRDHCLQKEMREGLEVARPRWYEEDQGSFLEHGSHEWWRLCPLPLRGHSRFHEQDSLTTETVCMRGVHLLLRNTGAASPVPSFLQDLQLPWWTCSSQTECQEVKVCGQGEAELVPSNAHRFTSTSRVAAEGCRVCAQQASCSV